MVDPIESTEHAIDRQKCSRAQLFGDAVRAHTHVLVVASPLVSRFAFAAKLIASLAV